MKRGQDRLRKSLTKEAKKRLKKTVKFNKDAALLLWCVRQDAVELKLTKTVESINEAMRTLDWEIDAKLKKEHRIDWDEAHETL